MFGIFKKKLSAEDSGHGLWLFCCSATEKFCRKYEPKLQAAGYLKNSNEVNRFRDESMRLYLWIVTRIMGVEFRNVLDVLHNYAIGLDLEILTRRYSIYDTAFAKEMEMHNSGNPNPVLAISVLRILLNNDSFTDVFIALEIHVDIDNAMSVVNETKSGLRIKP